MTTATIQEVTTQARFNNALKTIRKVGITTRLNVSSCCAGCVILPENTAILWTFGGQDSAFSWFEGTMVNRNVLAKAKRRGYNINIESITRARGIEKEVYFKFTDIIAAEAAQLAFEAEGFEVEWDGTDIQCVIVKM